MQSAKNKIVVASAGSRKTTMVVEEAIALSEKRVLITTYTHENLDQIKAYFIEKCGYVPKHVTLLPWFSFLLQEGVRPYQTCLTRSARISTIFFGNLSGKARYSTKASAGDYFLTDNGEIYRDRVSEFACACDENSGGLVVKRLVKAYDHVFVDEMQDFAGYDLVLLEKIFNSALPITAVCDPRQGTFSTNNSGKNKRFKKSGIWEWIHLHQKAGVITIKEKNECYRCIQAICDFADALFPGFSKTKSMNTKTTGHDGVFQVRAQDVAKYCADHKPVVLRWNRRSDTMGLLAINIGISKGRTYERVLIFPTVPMQKYLKTKNPEDAGDIAKLYVAVTRAKFSVAFVVE